MLNCNIILTSKYAIKHKTQSGKFDNSVEQVELDERKRQWIQEGVAEMNHIRSSWRF